MKYVVAIDTEDGPLLFDSAGVTVTWEDHDEAIKAARAYIKFGGTAFVQKLTTVSTVAKGYVQ